MTELSDRVTLVAGRLAVELVPAIGGSVSRLRIDGIDVLRPLSDEDRAGGNVLGVASFPMVPFANRIGGNAFEFEGRRYTFETNNPPERYHVHGTGWKHPWRVESASDREAVLALGIADPDTYSYEATQHFVLDEAGLDIVTTLTNRGARRMPFGFGHHPWFVRDADATVQFGAASFHLNEPDGMLGQRVSIPPELSFAAPQPLPAYWRCTDYGDWDGTATVRLPGPGAGLTMRGDAVFRHLMFYANPQLPAFCVEPQTNASGAFNRPHGFGDPEDNLVVLAPGESLSGRLRFEPFHL